MNFSEGFMVADAQDLRNPADYYLGREYRWRSGTRTRVLRHADGRLQLAGPSGWQTVVQVQHWVRNGTLTEVGGGL